eukprot:1159117-Pelagomonas_calceolata.AAC.5
MSCLLTLLNDSRLREGREQLAEGLRFLIEKGRGADRARVVLVLNPSLDGLDLTLLEVCKQVGRDIIPDT